MRNVLISGWVVALASSAACAQMGGDVARGPVARAQQPATLALLGQRLPEVAFTEAPFEQVVEWLGDVMQVNIVVHWQALEDLGISRDKPISLRARNLRLSQVLWLILNEAGGSDVRLAYQASDNLILISSHDDLGREMIVRVYDINDLLFEAPRFANAPQIDLQQVAQVASQAIPTLGGPGGNTGGNTSILQPGQEGPENRIDPRTRAGELVELIKGAIEPDSWDAGGGHGTISVFNGHLVVRNTILVHQRLGGYVRG